jgi:hypothetical protein
MNFEVGQLLSAASQQFRRHLLKCLPMAMVAVLASMAREFYWAASGHAPPTTLEAFAARPVPDDPVYWAIFAAGSLLSILLVSAVLLQLRSLAAGRQLPLADILRMALPRLWPATLALLLVALGATLLAEVLLTAGLGWVAYVLVALAALTLLALLLPVVLLEPLQPLAALLRSWALLRPIWVKVFACVLIALLIGAVCLLTLGLLATLVLVAVLGTQLASAVLQAVILAALAAFYVFACTLGLMLYTAASSSA